MSTPSDNELIELSKQGDQSAFRMLYERYEARVFNYVAKYLGNPDLAQEVTQNTFLAIYENLHRYVPSKWAGPWIYKIALNLSRNRYRQETKARQTISIDEPEEEGKSSLSDFIRAKNLDPREALRQKEYHEHIQKVLDAMPQIYREVLILHDIEEISYEEISRVLKIPYKTASKRLGKARLLFRRRIDPDRLGITLFILWARVKEMAGRFTRQVGMLAITDTTISLLIDGQLSEGDAQKVRSYVQDSADLRHALRLMEETKVILKNTPRLYPSLLLETQVMDFISRETLPQATPVFTPALRWFDQITEQAFLVPRSVYSVILAAVLTSSAVFWILGQESQLVPVASDVVGRPKQSDHTLRSGDKLMLRRLIQTGPSEELMVRRPGFMSLDVKENTALSVEQISYLAGMIGDHEIKLQSGTFFFKSEIKLRKGDFKVLTPWFVAVNQGTIASFSLNPEILRIAVLSGQIKLDATAELKPEFSKAILISEGEEFIYDRKLNKTVHRPLEEGNLKSLAAFGSQEDVVLLGLPPNARAQALVGKKQKFAFSMFNVKDAKQEKKINEIKHLFENQGPDTTASLSRAVRLLGEVKDDYAQRASPVVSSKLTLIYAAIYDLLGNYNEAIKSLNRIAYDQKIDSEIRSLAFCAAGIIYEEELGDVSRARQSYQEVLKFKPDTSVTEEARNRLKNMK